MSAAWEAMDLRDDGDRHYVAGQPIHCGDALEVQAIKREYDRDGNERVVKLDRGVVVRYELAGGGRLADRVRLHTDVGGHEFVGRLESWMRFRWPERHR